MPRVDPFQILSHRLTSRAISTHRRRSQTPWLPTPVPSRTLTLLQTFPRRDRTSRSPRLLAMRVHTTAPASTSFGLIPCPQVSPRLEPETRAFLQVPHRYVPPASSFRYPLLPSTPGSSTPRIALSSLRNQSHSLPSLFPAGFSRIPPGGASRWARPIPYSQSTVDRTGYKIRCLCVPSYICNLSLIS